MNPILRTFLNFILIMTVQLFLLNDIVIKSMVRIMGMPAFIPMLYPLVLLLLPVSIPSWLAMAIGMATGLLMDSFSNTPGMHAAACVLLAFMRPYILRLFFQQNAKELGDTVPSVFRMGFIPFALYATMCILLHHFFFYLIQFWSVHQILLILVKTLLSGVLSLLLILIAQMLFARKEIRRV
ncbi:MAG TPA: rod shape-determining protein MreD [Chitinophagaceae bacterium]|nr:rod shape-determining protein MreD [Chitinophagaceae bacterium]HNF71274.1 rod shape-determining protein MreD [Chitinophagaceae bacterium]